MADRRRYFFNKPDVDPSKLAEEEVVLSQTVELVKKLIRDYARKGPPNAKRVCRELEAHSDNDLVGVIAFPEDTLPDPVAVSNEEIPGTGKRKFMLMVSPLFLKQMKDSMTQRQAILGVLKAANVLVREIDAALEQGQSIMSSAEYMERIALSQQPRN